MQDELNVEEAATMKANAQGLLRAAKALLGEKTLPKGLHAAIDSLRAALKRTWADLEADTPPENDGGDEPARAPEPALATEAAVLSEAVTKTEDGKAFPASDFAYVPDAEKPSTWKLRLTSEPGEEPDAKIVGAAVAALGKGFRGQKVQIPEDDLPAVKAKVRAAWKKANPDRDEEEMPSVLKESAFSHEQVRTMLQLAVAGDRKNRFEIWTRDVYDDWFVYSDDADGKTYKRSYVISAEGVATLGDPVEVVAQMVYVPVGEAAVIESEFVPLVEKAVREDNTIPLKIIQPGWGSSGFYRKEVLKRDGPKAFPAKTKMFWNHPTPSEEAARPERDLRDLAAEFVTDATYKEDGPAGPGLYADAKVFSAFKGAVDELAPHIGVSIRALGRAKPGEAEGRKGPFIEEIVAGRSVDFVTVPGAGGQVLSLFEAARGGLPATTTQEVKNVTEEEAKKLKEENDRLRADVARMKEAALLQEARSFTVAELAKVELPDLTRVRLADALAAKPVIKDGALDKDAYTKAIQEAAKAEVDYLAKVGGSGAIRGMGSAGEPDKAKALEESYRNMYTRLGKSAEEADKLAKIAARGR